VAFQYAVRLGEALDAASRRYNDFVASYQSRLEPTLRKFEEAGVKSSKERPRLEPLAVRVRELSAAPDAEACESAPAETSQAETPELAAPAPPAPLPSAAESSAEESVGP
jgi:DNA anti-recombination protein RmuC